MVLYLAEKFQAFLPSDVAGRTETLNWLFWQMGSAPYVGGGFGHFYAYAPAKFEYAIDRFAMETKRQLDVLERRLATNEYLVGEHYTIADIAIYPWTRRWDKQGMDLKDYPNFKRWFEMVGARPAVQRGVEVLTTLRKPEMDPKEKEQLFGATQYQRRKQVK